MRIFLASLCATVFAASILHPATARAQTPTQTPALTGDMSGFNYLLGLPWGCKTMLPAIGDQPARTDLLTVAFDVAPGNTIHDHVSGEYFMGDDYFGYSHDTNNYWSTSANSGGFHGVMTSTDGKTFTGTSWQGSITMSVTNTYTRAGDNVVTMRQVISQGGKDITINSTCTR
jgi:hypothetical protein